MEYINNQIIRKYISYQKGGKYEKVKELIQILNSDVDPSELIENIENQTKLLEESAKNSEIYSTIDEAKFKDQVLKFHNILYNLFNNLDIQSKSSIQLKDNSIDISVLEDDIDKEIIELENLFENIIYHVDSGLVGEVSENIEYYNVLLTSFQTKLDGFITKFDELKKMKFVFALDVDKLNDKILQDIRANLVRDTSIEPKEFNYNERFYLEAIDSKTEDIDQEIFEILNNEKMLKLFNIQSNLLNFIKSGEVFKIISPTKINGKITYIPQNLIGPINEKTKNVEMLKKELDEITKKISDLEQELSKLESEKKMLDDIDVFKDSKLFNFTINVNKNRTLEGKFFVGFQNIKNKYINKEEGFLIDNIIQKYNKNIETIKDKQNKVSASFYKDVKNKFAPLLKNLEDKNKNKKKEMDRLNNSILKANEQIENLKSEKKNLDLNLSKTEEDLNIDLKNVPWIQKGGINLEIALKQKALLSNIVLKLRILLDNFNDFKEKTKDINKLNANINLSILIILLSIKIGRENKLKNISISKSILEDLILKIRLILDYKEEGDILDFLRTFTSILNWVNDICQKVIKIMNNNGVINYDNLQNESKKFVSFIKINYYLIENLHNLISKN